MTLSSSCPCPSANPLEEEKEGERGTKKEEYGPFERRRRDDQEPNDPASQPEYQTDRQSSKNRVVSQLLLSDTCKRELGSPSPSLSQAQVR